jgi:REP element-mobilizing transposase RayT
LLDGTIRLRNRPNTPLLPANPTLEQAVKRRLREVPVALSRRHARCAFAAIEETCGFRAWRLLAAAIMATHLHVIVGVAGDPDSAAILRDLKSYASRRLNRAFGGRPNRWWTESGSRRKLLGEVSVRAAMRYVRDQERPLVVWIDERAFGG